MCPAAAVRPGGHDGDQQQRSGAGEQGQLVEPVGCEVDLDVATGAGRQQPSLLPAVHHERAQHLPRDGRLPTVVGVVAHVHDAIDGRRIHREPAMRGGPFGDTDPGWRSAPAWPPSAARPVAVALPEGSGWPRCAKCPQATTSLSGHRRSQSAPGAVGPDPGPSRQASWRSQSSPPAAWDRCHRADPASGPLDLPGCWQPVAR